MASVIQSLEENENNSMEWTLIIFGIWGQLIRIIIMSKEK